MSELESLASRASELTSKVDFWNAAVLWALLITFVAAGAIVFSQRLAFVRAKELSDVQEKISDIKEATARERIANLENESAHLKKATEDERLARVELESKVAWRKLDSHAQSGAASHLTRFAKEPALVAYNTQDIEATSFASDIAAMLHAAKWDVPEPLGMTVMREGPVPLGTNPRLPTGVVVWCTSDEPSRTAATALVGELSSRGFDAIISPEHQNLLGIHPTPTRVVIFVEHKPEGPQGEYKLRAQTKTASQ